MKIIRKFKRYIMMRKFEKLDNEPITILDVAHFFLASSTITIYEKGWKEHNEDYGVNSKKLQLLCYYAQAWNIAYFDKPLFSDEFIAWNYPFNSSLHNRFKENGFHSIPYSHLLKKHVGFNDKPFQYKGYYFSSEKPIQITVPEHKFSAEELSLLDEVWNVYGGVDSRILEYDITESHPFKKAKREHEAVNIKDMASYYGVHASKYRKDTNQKEHVF